MSLSLWWDVSKYPSSKVNRIRKSKRGISSFTHSESLSQLFPTLLVSLSSYASLPVYKPLAELSALHKCYFLLLDYTVFLEKNFVYKPFILSDICYGSQISFFDFNILCVLYLTKFPVSKKISWIFSAYTIFEFLSLYLLTIHYMHSPSLLISTPHFLYECVFIVICSGSR